ncbi:tail completion protein R (GpR) [Vibrio sp. ES.051]|uniref:phage tail protein n=1 Tax=Vibrio sp. ES.051 TaxID=1761909 RepID=UPI000BF4A964|nr:phage tail protein [Vibrio sp. ES.051]PFG55738.1 tail completion protein R (GpR) [Vibrio sp. ES.051]
MKTQYQAGYKLRDLSAFLTAVVGDKIAKRMECEMGKVELKLETKHMGHGFDLIYQRYVADFYFDKFPFKEYDPAVLFANVGAWLMDNDVDRFRIEELADPDVDIVLEDEKNAEVLISVMFEEPVKVIEHPEGPIYWNSRRWKIEEYEIWQAQRLSNITIRNV